MAPVELHVLNANVRFQMSSFCANLFSWASVCCLQPRPSTPLFPKSGFSPSLEAKEVSSCRKVDDIVLEVPGLHHDRRYTLKIQVNVLKVRIAIWVLFILRSLSKFWQSNSMVLPPNADSLMPKNESHSYHFVLYIKLRAPCQAPECRLDIL